jgi:tetratricopeptide (TPR) repeat protein
MDLPGQRPSPPTPFVANGDTLALATEALAQPGHAVALIGPPGSGKTSLAAMLADQLADNFEGEPLWINCERHLGQPHAMADLATAVLERLDYEFSSLSRGEVVEAMKDKLRDRHLLVVLDGIEDEGQVRDLVPDADWGSSLIVSSRENLDRVGIPRVDLGPLSVREGVNLLRETAGYPKKLEDEALSTALVEAAAGLPLAIRMVGSHIATGTSPETLLHSLRSESARLSLVASESDPSSLQSALATTYEALSTQGEELFRLIGLLTSDSFTATELEREIGLPLSSIGELKELVALGLLETDGESYRLHPLIRRFARDQLGRAELDPEAARLARSHLEDPVYERLDQEEERSESSTGSLDEHVAAQEYALRVATEASDQNAVAQALHNLGILYASGGQLDDAQGTFQAALSVADAIGDLYLGARLNLALGRVAREQHDLQSAESHIRVSLAMFEASEDLDGQRNALIHLGDLLVAGERLDAAEVAYERALASTGDAEATASILGRKALLASRSDDPSRARPLYEIALEAMESAGGESERAAMLRQLSIVLMRDEDVVGAAERLQESFSLFRHAGNAHGTAMTALAISGTLLVAGDADRAQAWLTEAEGPVERLQNSQLTAIVAFASSLIAETQEKWDQARALQEEAISWFRKTEDRVGEARSLLALGALLERGEEREEAAVVTRLGEKLLEEQDEGKLSPQEALLQMVLH